MDWMAFTLPDVSAQEVMRQIGGEWTKGKAGFRGYPLSWILTDTSRGVGMLGTDAPRQPREVHVDLSAGIVSPWNLSRVRNILQWIKHHEGHVTRIDCALDDRQSVVPLQLVTQAAEIGQCISRADRIQMIRSFSLHKGTASGETIYFGSPELPRQVPTPALMDALIAAAQQRQRRRDIAIFLIMRYTGMRRESVATLQVRHLDGTWGLRRVRVKGGQTRDIPLPESVMAYLYMYVERLTQAEGQIGPETPLFWSLWGRRTIGKSRAPMKGKNIWRPCKTYGRLIGYPMLKPHDLRHGVAMEVLEQQHDLEQVRALLGHARIDTTQIYTMIRPSHLKQVVSFYEEPARRMLTS